MTRKNTVRASFPLALFAGAILFSTPAPATGQGDESIERGAQLWLQGKTKEALDEFRKVLAEDPSNEEALSYMSRGGLEVWMLMIQEGGEYETLAKAFFEKARIARKDKTSDAAAIAGLVEQAMSGDYLARRDSLGALSADHGEYGAAPFITYLGEEDDADARVNAIFCLVSLSGDSVLPLLAALGSDNDRKVWNACACLGTIGDGRATAGLKAVYETCDSQNVREAADEALAKITGSAATSLPAAADLHIDAATSYFRRDDRVVQPFDTKDAVWFLEGDGVQYEQVPAMLRHLRLAETHCLAALKDSRAQDLLFAIYASQKAAVQGASSMEGVEIDSDLVDSLTARVDIVLGAAGPGGLSGALQFALDQDAPQCATVLIDALSSAGERTPGLNGALSSPYKSVRYAASFALAMNGHVDGGVVEVLGQALGEDDMRTVLIVDNDENNRNTLTAAFANAGFAVMAADSGAVGFARARMAPPKDVILVRAGLEDAAISQFVYDADFRTSASPMLVLTDEASKDALESNYGGRGNVQGFISTDALDPATAVTAVKDVLGDLNPERSAALSAAETAARIVAHLNAAQLAAIQGDLIKALDRSEESVLGPVLGAVASLGPASAASAVSSIFASTDWSEDVRVAAAGALGGIFAQSDASPGSDVVDVVKQAALTDDSAAVRVAASRALGFAGFLTTEERAAILGELHQQHGGS